MNFNASRKTALALGLGLLALACSPDSFGQVFPSKAIRLVVPFPPGGANDVLGRLIGHVLSEQLGQPVVIDNRAGAGGNIGTEFVAHAAPDGYTLLYTTNALTIGASLYPKLPYKLEELQPVSLVATFPVAIVVNPKVPANTLPELVELSKKKGGLNYGSVGSGSANHLTGVQLNKAAGINNVHVPYKGAGPMMLGIVGGEIDIATPTLISAVPYVKTGQLRAIAVTGSTPSPSLPGVPALGAAYPGFETSVWHGFLTTAGVPPTVLEVLNREIVKAIKSPKVREAITKGGGDVVANSPAEFAAILSAEIPRYAELVRISGAKPD
jgi:tripartite-type tricarboxylate transporter receptor subunit TctC